MATTNSGGAQGPSAPPLGELISIIDAIGLTKMLNLSSTVLYIYEMLTTFDREVTFMWTSGFNIGKLLYFVIRYFTLIVMVAIHGAIFMPNGSAQAPHGSDFISIHQLSSMGWYNLRVYAMFHKNKAILAVCSASLICTFAMANIIASFTMKGAEISFVDLGPGSNMHSCGIVSMNDWYKAFWGAKTFNEVLLFSLALFKGIRSYRSRSHSAVSYVRLIDILVRDSVLYFLVVFVSYIMSWIVWLTKGVSYLEAPAGFAMALESIMSQRLLINVLLEYSERGRRNQWSDQNTGSMPAYTPQTSVVQKFHTPQADVELIESSRFRRRVDDHNASFWA
ncbi:uncharacterized protein FOMMEDRAFT_160026 [Fomitiporia mediterranea MF3/22]|uniref:uncharacterized protein n=1 Tax=Fomitiporia mediterranea (strain MF3/22) TaxID=694068 RepID=UPI000440843B|nr:uncharacterized protein FOMMEDRAFT_160026 [Fomitiporia mediterranea MF3/22]EJC99604.1 hypothetical protein FOMMEDRAFT_160026 [Fomitiporia mediterranea MF3/22]